MSRQTQSKSSLTVSAGLESPQITPEMVDYYVRYGQRLRSAMIAMAISRAWASIARLWRAPAMESVRPIEMKAERFANSLAAIRSSAESLRDAKDMSEVERARFVRIVLEEEFRLEQMLSETVRRGHLRANVT